MYSKNGMIANYAASHHTHTSRTLSVARLSTLRLQTRRPPVSSSDSESYSDLHRRGARTAADRRMIRALRAYVSGSSAEPRRLDLPVTLSIEMGGWPWDSFFS